MAATSNQFYHIDRRVVWGDYGALLAHGEGQFEQLVDHALGTLYSVFKYEGIFPFAELMLPDQTIVVSAKLKEEIHNAIPQLEFHPVFEELVVSLDWRKYFRKSKNPPYPPSGEPEDYFTSLPIESGFSAGLSERLFWIKPTQNVRVEVLEMSRGRFVKRVTRLPEACHLVTGSVSNTTSDLFCSQDLYTLLKAFDEVVKFTPLDADGKFVDEISTVQAVR